VLTCSGTMTTLRFLNCGTEAVRQQRVAALILLDAAWEAAKASIRKKTLLFGEGHKMRRTVTLLVMAIFLVAGVIFLRWLTRVFS